MFFNLIPSFFRNRLIFWSTFTVFTCTINVHSNLAGQVIRGEFIAHALVGNLLVTRFEWLWKKIPSSSRLLFLFVSLVQRIIGLANSGISSRIWKRPFLVFPSVIFSYDFCGKITSLLKIYTDCWKRKKMFTALQNYFNKLWKLIGWLSWKWAKLMFCKNHFLGHTAIMWFIDCWRILALALVPKDFFIQTRF